LENFVESQGSELKQEDQKQYFQTLIKRLVCSEIGQAGVILKTRSATQEATKKEPKKSFAAFQKLSKVVNKVCEEGLSLEEVLHKLYFQGYSYSDVQNLLPFALQKVKNANQFFETLFATVKNYAEQVRKVRCWLF